MPLAESRNRTVLGAAGRWLKAQRSSDDPTVAILLGLVGSLAVLGAGVGLGSLSAVAGGITALAGFVGVLFATAALFVSNFTDPLKKVGLHPLVGAFIGTLVVALFLSWLGAAVILAEAPLRHHHISVTAHVVADAFEAWSPALALPLIGFLAVRYARLYNQRHHRVSDTERILAQLETLNAKLAGASNDATAQEPTSSHEKRHGGASRASRRSRPAR